MKSYYHYVLMLFHTYKAVKVYRFIFFFRGLELEPELVSVVAHFLFLFAPFVPGKLASNLYDVLDVKHKTVCPDQIILKTPFLRDFP